MIVGAFALAAHGYPRYTKDIDILIDPKEENAPKMLAVLEDFGFGSLGIELKDFQDPDILQLG